jgi:hypothetical protein
MICKKVIKVGKKRESDRYIANVTVKDKVILCFINYHAKKTYGGMEV